MAFAQASDPRLGRVKGHSLGHSRRQRNLYLNVEFSPQHVLRQHVEDQVFIVSTEFVLDGVEECHVRHRWLSVKHRIDQADGEHFVISAAEQHFEGIVDERINSKGHRHLPGEIRAAEGSIKESQLNMHPRVYFNTSLKQAAVAEKT